MEVVEFRQVHRQVDGATVESWLEYRALTVVGGVLGQFGPWRRVDATTEVIAG